MVRDSKEAIHRPHTPKTVVQIHFPRPRLKEIEVGKKVFFFGVVCIVILALVTGNVGANTKNNCASEVLGDVNWDKVVDLRDLSLMSAAWGKSYGQPGYWKSIDLDCSGKIGEGDMIILRAGWQLQDLVSGVITMEK
jgi:hypothetical protein